MASLVSGSAEASAHLHLDPSLQIPVKNKCEDCMPGGSLLFRLFCCHVCFRSNCCNTTIERDDHAIYCHKNGRCEIFDASKAEDSEKALKESAERVKKIVEQEKRLSRVHEATGIDLARKAERGEPIKIHELRRLQTM